MLNNKLLSSGKLLVSVPLNLEVLTVTEVVRYVYCKSCNGYGPRVLVKCDEHDKPTYLQFIDIDYNEEAKAKAIEAWNRRSN